MTTMTMTAPHRTQFREKSKKKFLRILSRFFFPDDSSISATRRLALAP